MSEKLISKKKRNWAGKRDTNLLGTPLNYNVSSQKRYEKAIAVLVEEMAEEVKKTVIELFRTETAKEFFEQQKKSAAMDANIGSQAKTVMNKLMDSFSQLFSKKASGLAEAMLNGAFTISKTTLHTSLKELSGGLSLKTGVVPEGMKNISKAIVEENVNLIKSIPQKYLNDITQAVMRSITTSSGLKYLIPQIQKYTDQTHRRVKNIALDQTRKAYNSINKERMQSVGVKKFKWLHTGGSQHPRKDHIAMSGSIYSFDNLPIIDKRSGEKGIPGQAINCRCTMVPVIELENGEIV